MSSILKALRKLEDEKADMGEGSVDLARDILKRSYEERRSYSLWGIAALGGACVLIAAGWWGFSSTDRSQQPAVSVGAVVTSTSQVKPVAVEASVPPAAPVVVMPTLQVETIVAIPQKKRPAVSKQFPVVASKPIPVTVVKANDNPLVIPDFVIEEIVFVDDPSARLAVINDLPVMQGTDIEGARVVEISPDRVRFEYQGIRFDKFKAK